MNKKNIISTVFIITCIISIIYNILTSQYLFSLIITSLIVSGIIEIRINKGKYKNGLKTADIILHKAWIPVTVIVVLYYIFNMYYFLIYYFIIALVTIVCILSIIYIKITSV